jgi:K+-sensing histidine kinase KdpD
MLSKSTENVEIGIRDYGFGVPEDDQKQLFDLFYLAENVKRTEGIGVQSPFPAKLTKAQRSRYNYHVIKNDNLAFTHLLCEHSPYR